MKKIIIEYEIKLRLRGCIAYVCLANIFFSTSWRLTMLFTCRFI